MIISGNVLQKLSCQSEQKPNVLSDFRSNASISDEISIGQLVLSYRFSIEEMTLPTKKACRNKTANQDHEMQ